MLQSWCLQIHLHLYTLLGRCHKILGNLERKGGVWTNDYTSLLSPPGYHTPPLHLCICLIFLEHDWKE